MIACIRHRLACAWYADRHPGAARVGFRIASFEACRRSLHVTDCILAKSLT